MDNLREAIVSPCFLKGFRTKPRPVAPCDFHFGVGGGSPSGSAQVLNKKYTCTYYCSSPWRNVDHICIVNKVVGIGFKLSIFPLINRGGNIYTDRLLDIL